jgi:DNA-binding CsgD family transcriptional regulator
MHIVCPAQSRQLASAVLTRPVERSQVGRPDSGLAGTTAPAIWPGQDREPQHAALIGRKAELASIAAATADIMVGFRALVLAGEPGIGKSVLWEAAIAGAHACGCAVLQARTSESEAPLSYSGLTDLFETVQDQTIRALPAPQQIALEVALLRRTAGQVDARALAVALLGTIRILAAERPVLVAIDDDQWLDPATEDALAYALRRLRDEPVLAVLTHRLDDSTAAGGAAALSDVLRASVPAVVGRVDVGPLDFGSIRQLIAGGDRSSALSLQLCRRIHQMSGGNPFYASEVANALPASASISGELPVPPSLITLLVGRLNAMTPRVRDAVLLAALLASPNSNLVERALVSTAAVGDRASAVAALDEAVSTRLLVRSEHRIRLAHPLFGAAARSQAAAGQIRSLHGVLAALVTGSEEQARHLALASSAPDSAVARRLANAAEDAAEHGSATAAAELSELAWRFTPPGDPLRPARLIALARRLRWAGGVDAAARQLLEEEIPAMPAGPERAEARYLLADMSGLSHPAPLYYQALAEAGPTIRGYILAQFAGHAGANGNVGQAVEWAREAFELTATGADPLQRSDVIWQLAWIESLAGLDPEPRLAELDSMGPVPGQPSHDWPTRIRAVRAMWRGDVATAGTMFGSLLQNAREREEDWSVITLTLHQLELTVRTGEWLEAAKLRDELAILTAPYERTLGVTCRARAYLAAAAGDRDLVRSLADEIDEMAARQEFGQLRWHQLEIHRAVGLAALLAGDAADAARSLSVVYRDVTDAGYRDPGTFPVGPDLVEALAQAGRLDEADRVLAEFADAASSLDHPWATAGAARASAAVHSARGDDAAAVGELERAMVQYAELRLPFDEARSLLALGTVRRRLRQFRQARALLLDAAARLDELGCPPLSTRAKDELSRIGGRRETGGLTPTEVQVAALVASGYTNRQVAEQLYISVSAVEAHLTRIYARLGITNRTQLAGRAADLA